MIIDQHMRQVCIKRGSRALRYMYILCAASELTLTLQMSPDKLLQSKAKLVKVEHIRGETKIHISLVTQYRQTGAQYCLNTVHPQQERHYVFKLRTEYR